MARKLHTSLLLTGKLETTGPLHVGGEGEGIEVDMPLATNGLGERYLPGTSLTGALRSWMESILDKEMINKWFGFQGPGDDNGNASRLFVEDARITLPRGTETEVWHGVGIDRQWGTAATGIKFSREVLPKGTTFPLELRLDVAEESDLPLARAALWHLAKGLESGLIELGAATTRGLGRIKFKDNWKAEERNWIDREGVLNFLFSDSGTSPSKDNDWKTAADEVKSFNVSPVTVDITITWKPVGPLMSKAPRDGLAVDALPMLSASGDQLAMVLPGSSIKGVLRGQAERIVRTLLDLDVSQKKSRTRHLEQLAVPLVFELFGSARPDTGKKGTPSPPARRGALSVPSCYATNSEVTPQNWAAIADAPTTGKGECSPLPNLFNTAGIGEFQHAFHVAVDRWTGGAAEQMLYSAVEPFNVKWEPIQLRLHLRNLEKKGAAMALLWLVLRDLWEGNLGLGFGINRGYGAIKVLKIELNGLEQLNGIEHLSCPSTAVILTITEGRINLEQINPCLGFLQSEWNTWLREFDYT